MKVTSNDDERIQIFFDTVDLKKVDEIFEYSHTVDVSKVKSTIKLLDLLESTKINTYFYNPLNIPKGEAVRSALKSFHKAFSGLYSFVQRLIKSDVMGVTLSTETESWLRDEIKYFNFMYKNLLLAVDHKITEVDKEKDKSHYFEQKPDGVYFLGKKIDSSNSKQARRNSYFNLLKILLDEYPEGQINVPIKAVFGNISFDKLKQALDKSTKGLWGYIKNKDNEKNVIEKNSKQKIISFNKVNGKECVTFINLRRV